MSDAEKYTVPEVERMQVENACIADGHQPVVFDFEMTGFCLCGKYRWTGKLAAAPS